jgi:hypothetical protein
MKQKCAANVTHHYHRRPRHFFFSFFFLSFSPSLSSFPLSLSFLLSPLTPPPSIFNFHPFFLSYFFFSPSFCFLLSFFFFAQTRTRIASFPILFPKTRLPAISNSYKKRPSPAAPVDFFDRGSTVATTFDDSNFVVLIKIFTKIYFKMRSCVK